MNRRRACLSLAVACLVLTALAAHAGEGDRDGDGMPDSWEKAHGLDPDDPSDASEDADSDRLLNREEYWWDGDPQVADTDRDGLRDGPEIFLWHSQLDAPNRLVGRVSARRRCPTRDPACPIRQLFAVRVILRDSDGQLVAAKRTASNGRFAFGDLAPGRYQVEARAVPGIGAPGPVPAHVEEDQEEPARVYIRMRNRAGPGVVGQATMGPTCAAQRKGDECARPVEGARIRVKDRDGNVVARAVTGPDGYYAFELRLSDYTVVAKHVEGSDWPYPPPRKRVTVERDDQGPHVVNRSYETGIR